MDERRSRRRGSVVTALLALYALAVVGGCSRSGSYSNTAVNKQVDPVTGTSASPRLHAEGERIPKGGGVYKIGGPYKIAARWYLPAEDPNYDRVGFGSWYGAEFHGRRTANGEIFDMNALTAAHPTLPLPSYAYVTNLFNNRTLLVRINDRGPYAHDRVIDLSRRSARELGYEIQGTAHLRVRYAGRAPLDGNDMHEQRFLAGQPPSRGIASLNSDGSSKAYTQQLQRPLASLPPSGLTWRR